MCVALADLSMLEFLRLGAALFRDSLLSLFGVEIPGATTELDFRVAFEAENMRGDAVEEIAIMRNHDRAAWILGQGFFEDPQGHQIEVIRSVHRE